MTVEQPSRKRKQFPLEQEWFSAEEAAEFLGIGERQFRDMVKAKRMPHVRVGDRILLNRYALRSWGTRESWGTVAT